MLIVISPSKQQDYTKEINTNTHTIPIFLSESEKLINILRGLKKDETIKLLKINSDKFLSIKSNLKSWNIKHLSKKAKAAILSFKGEAYKNIKAHKFTVSDMEFLNKHFRIVSGLYGLLRPLDIIMPHRLEMNSNLKNEKGKNLYKFWSKLVTKEINKTCKELGYKCLLNLSSKEYFKVIDKKVVSTNIVNVSFLENVNGINKQLGVFSKQARGLMVNYIVKNRITTLEELKSFNLKGYLYDEKLSNNNELVYIR